MEARHGVVRFDGAAVRAIVAHLSESADDADREIRRAFGGLEFDVSGAGTHEAAGAGVEDGYRRLRAACQAWVVASQAHAEALRVATEHYAQHERDTEAGLAAGSEWDERRTGQP
ncbi:hypothetical protein [Rhodococcus sp. CH91]|uniref:hypothetical protein n=1 Tax=Rhodococcus sp. CH91 TaxID=2910256 RepID=UPI001F4A2308|nr:hypothetical protein [Rhodococcus sp. CH91]